MPKVFLHLKSHETDKTGFPARFAILVEPTPDHGLLTCDDDLYRFLSAHVSSGGIILIREKKLMEVWEQVQLTLEDFKATWKGD